MSSLPLSGHYLTLPWWLIRLSCGQHMLQYNHVLACPLLVAVQTSTIYSRCRAYIAHHDSYALDKVSSWPAAAPPDSNSNSISPDRLELPEHHMTRPATASLSQDRGDERDNHIDQLEPRFISGRLHPRLRNQSHVPEMSRRFSGTRGRRSGPTRRSWGPTPPRLSLRGRAVPGSRGLSPPARRAGLALRGSRDLLTRKCGPSRPFLATNKSSPR